MTIKEIEEELQYLSGKDYTYADFQSLGSDIKSLADCLLEIVKHISNLQNTMDTHQHVENIRFG